MKPTTTRAEAMRSNGSVYKKRLPNASSIDVVLSLIEEASATGWRNRCMYLLKGKLRYEDISHLRLCHLIDQHGEIVNWLRTAGSGLVELGEITRSELRSYLCRKYGISAACLPDLLKTNSYDSVFGSHRRTFLTPCVVAQVFSDLDRAIHGNIALT